MYQVAATQAGADAGAGAGGGEPLRYVHLAVLTEG
jgi:hypothetical protein